MVLFDLPHGMPVSAIHLKKIDHILPKGEAIPPPPLYSSLAIHARSGIINNMEHRVIKALSWIGSAKDDLREFPESVKELMGYALYLAQTGGKHPAAKPLKGFTGAGVLEIVEDHRGDTYRAVYTVRFADAIYVLHAFQKKSKSGIATPQRDIELIKSRLQRAIEHHT